MAIVRGLRGRRQVVVGGGNLVRSGLGLGRKDDPLARLEGQIALSTLLRRLPDLRLEPGPLVWRDNLGLRGLTALPVAFAPSRAGARSRRRRLPSRDAGSAR